MAFALAHAGKLLDKDTGLARQQAVEILRVVPGQPQALLILAVAQRRRGDIAGALSSHRLLVALQPGAFAPYFQLGQTLSNAGDATGAVTALQRATRLDANQTDGWRLLGDHYRLLGRTGEASHCNDQQIRSAVYHPELMAAAEQLCQNRLPAAEAGLRDYLKRFPTDFVAIRMLAELASRLGRYEDAEQLLRRCLELAPNFTAAERNYALVLQRQNKVVEALAVIAHQLALEPGDPSLLSLKASCLVKIGKYAEAIAIYADILPRFPDQPKLWMSYGHALKTENQSAAAIVAYRRSIEQMPELGEAYWSLANLKTFRFTESESEAMQTQLARPDLGAEDRLHLHFALGKAAEDDGAYALSFQHYQAGNRLRHDQIGYDALDTALAADRAIRLFDAPFLRRHAGAGSPATDPIFIVGLPRSGSTLIEQILASHASVEGTMELPDLQAIAKLLGGRKKIGDPSAYPEMLAELDAAQLQGLGEDYLERTRIQRKTDRPFFIDKMPNNFFHVGLIHLILPRARIIDARRHPLACCFSAFKQHFARGQGFSYDLADLGRYYADYVRLMAHFDAVLPGRVHRVYYERMVADSEPEIRRLLDYCGLAFDPDCLTFWRNSRSVRTASAEQVRQPIYTEGLQQWRHFEAWLDPLKAALGTVLEDYPA